MSRAEVYRCPNCGYFFAAKSQQPCPLCNHNNCKAKKPGKKLEKLWKE